MKRLIGRIVPNPGFEAQESGTFGADVPVVKPALPLPMKKPTIVFNMDSSGGAFSNKKLISHSTKSRSPTLMLPLKRTRHSMLKSYPVIGESRRKKLRHLARLLRMKVGAVAVLPRRTPRVRDRDDSNGSQIMKKLHPWRENSLRRPKHHQMMRMNPSIII